MSDTIERAGEIFDLCLRQETDYAFDKFLKEDALKLGIILGEKAKKHNQGVAIEIMVNGVVWFSHCQEGAGKENFAWIRRKRNVVELTGMSTLRHRVMMEKDGITLVDRKLEPNDYAEFGGGFPLNINGVGMIGSICISGLPHLDDHQVIVDSLKEFQCK